MLSATVIYDILRDGIGATPIVLFLLWLLGPVVVLSMVLRPRRGSRPPPGLGLSIGLALWLVPGGFGFGNVFYRHFHCRAAAASGNVQIVQGPVTAYHPEDPDKREGQEIISVSGRTWTYSSANLSRGGYRGKPSAKNRIRVGSTVRIASYDGRILKLELLDDSPRPAG